jgi:hypothetical protein
MFFYGGGVEEGMAAAAAAYHPGSGIGDLGSSSSSSSSSAAGAGGTAASSQPGMPSFNNNDEEDGMNTRLKPLSAASAATFGAPAAVIGSAGAAAAAGGAGAGAGSASSAASAASAAEVKLKNDIEVDDNSKHAAKFINKRIYTSVTYQELIIQLLDSLHDGWTAPRGDVPNKQALNTYIREHLINIVYAICVDNGKDLTHFNPGADANTRMNTLLALLLPAGIPIDISKIEKTSSAYYASIDSLHIYDYDKIDKEYTYDDILRMDDSGLADALQYSIWRIKPSNKDQLFSGLPDGAKLKINQFIAYMLFKEQYKDPKFRYYVTIDGLPGSLAESVMINDPAMNLLITPANVADSAPTSEGVDKTKSVTAFFSSNGESGEPAIYVSENNAFGILGGYQLAMLNNKFDFNKHTFYYVLQKFDSDGKLEYTQAFDYGAQKGMQGPSLNYLVQLTAAATKVPPFVGTECKGKQLCIGDLLQPTFAQTIAANINNAEKPINVLLDIKRAGDGDQRTMAQLAKAKLGYVVTGTGDHGLADALIYKDMHTVDCNTSTGEIVIRRGADPAGGAAVSAGLSIEDEKELAEAAAEERYSELIKMIRTISNELLDGFIGSANALAANPPFIYNATKKLFNIKIKDIQILFEEFKKIRDTLAVVETARNVFAKFNAINITIPMLTNMVKILIPPPPAEGAAAAAAPPPFDHTATYMFCNYSYNEFVNIDNLISGMIPTGEVIIEPVDFKKIAYDPFIKAITDFEKKLYYHPNPAFDVNAISFETITGIDQTKFLSYEQLIQNYNTMQEIITGTGGRSKRIVRLFVDPTLGEFQEVWKAAQQNITAKGKFKKVASLEKAEFQNIDTNFARTHIDKIKNDALASTLEINAAMTAYYTAMNGGAGGGAAGAAEVAVAAVGPAAGGAGAGAGAGRYGGGGRWKQRGGATELDEVTNAFREICGMASEFVNGTIAELDDMAALYGNVADIQYRYSKVKDYLPDIGGLNTIAVWITTGNVSVDPITNALFYPLYNAYITFFNAIGITNPTTLGGHLTEAELIYIAKTNPAEVLGFKTEDPRLNPLLNTFLRPTVDNLYTVRGKNPEYGLPFFTLTEIIARSDPAEIEQTAETLTSKWMAIRAKYNNPTIEAIYTYLEPYSYDAGTKTAILKNTHYLVTSGITTLKKTQSVNYFAKSYYGGNLNFAKMEGLMMLTAAHDFMLQAGKLSIFLPYIYDYNPATIYLAVNALAEWNDLPRKLDVYYNAIYYNNFPPEVAKLVGGGRRLRKTRRLRRNRRPTKTPNPFQSYSSIAKSLQSKMKRRKTRRQKNKK